MGFKVTTTGLVVPFRSNRRGICSSVVRCRFKASVFHEKDRRSFIIWNIQERHCPPLYIDAPAQLDMHPSHFSTVCAPPLCTRGTNRVLSFVHLYSERDKAIFSALGPARVQLDPCGRRRQRRPWKTLLSLNLMLSVPSPSCNISWSCPIKRINDFNIPALKA